MIPPFASEHQFKISVAGSTLLDQSKKMEWNEDTAQTMSNNIKFV